MPDSKQYAVLNSSADAVTVLAWISQHNLPHQVHLNRTRFWVPLGTPLYTDFALRFAELCFPVQDPLFLSPEDC